MEMNVNISNKLNFSDVYQNVNYTTPLEFINFARDSSVVYTLINLRKIKLIH